MAIALSNPAFASTIIYVDDDTCPDTGTGILDDPYCSIQTAIDAAADFDQVFVAQGTYTEIIDMRGKAIAVRSMVGAAGTVIDAGPVPEPGTGKPVVRCESGEGPDTILEGFTITGGSGNQPNGCCIGVGGGMYIVNSSPTVTNCTFRENTALVGSGIYSVDGSHPTITNCTFSGNTRGAAMTSQDGNPVVTNCTFIGNDGGMTNGGGSPVVMNCKFIGNAVGGGRTASSGGGMSNGGCISLTVMNCTFIRNTAGSGQFGTEDGAGGGMWNNNTGITTITNCTFIGNTANNKGGGMYNTGLPSSPRPQITNCTFIGNTVTTSNGSKGGGMFNANYSGPILTNCTFIRNSATGASVGQGGGVYISEMSNTTILNCIFWENSDTGGIDESGQIHGEGNGHFPLVHCSNIQGGWTGIGKNNINANPMFHDLDGADDTVATADDNLHLARGSPCIDAGDNSVVTASTDLDGNPRISNGTVDMGAMESFSSCDSKVHNITQDTAFSSLQSAIEAAVPGDEIEAGPCIYNERINFNGKAITLRSSAPTSPAVVASTIIDGSNLGGSVVQCANGEKSTTVLNGFTIVRGQATNGGGMFVDNASSPTVMNCTFRGNSATLHGGGIYNDNNSRPAVTNCEFNKNTAFLGGGMFNDRGSSPTVLDCTFDGNVAAGGGGMLNRSRTVPKIANCIFRANTATRQGGGGMFNLSGDPTVTNCIFSGNIAPNSTGEGGGMLNSSASPTVVNCTFVRNSAAGGGPFDGGGGMASFHAQTFPNVVNCIFWENWDADGVGESAQIHTGPGSVPVVTYSNIQGGWTGTGGIGNINENPLFVDADGPDHVAGTADDDLRLAAGSPCIDAGDNRMVTEPVDLDGNPRVINCPVDMGAHENQAVGRPPVHNVTRNTFFGTLQAAILAAVEDDVIEAIPCTYYELIDFNGKQKITLHSTDPSNPKVVARTIIDGTGLGDSVVKCVSGEDETTLLNGFTITGGRAPFGGGLHINSSTPSLKNCIFRDNTASYDGGGIFITGVGVSPTVEYCTFDSNRADNGGGIHNQFSQPTVANCLFIGNKATNNGGGMNNTDLLSKPEVTDCTFRGNSAENGGAMHNEFFCKPIVTNCTFHENTAMSRGGAIFNRTGVVSKMANCSFAKNLAHGHGGAMYDAENSTSMLKNCTFSRNAASGNGGGIYHSAGTLNAWNCIFWENTDREGQGESAQIRGDSLAACVVNFSNVQGGWTGAGINNLGTDPLFVNPSTGDIHLYLISPCIDSGDNEAVNEPSDLLGGMRIFNGTVDRGAYEAQSLTVPADRDEDNDVDGTDFAAFAQCFNNVNNPPRTLGCTSEDAAAFDFDSDDDIDGADFAKFTLCFNKAGNPPRTVGCPQN